MSGGAGNSSHMASFTQSAGVPVTAQPRMPLSGVRGCTRMGSARVMAWPTADCSVSGATTQTSCSGPRAAYRALVARGVGPVVVGD